MRYFNTVGPVNCQYHYCLPPLGRLNMAEIERLLAKQKYFVLHAPRQTGKTTFLYALANYLNQQGLYHCVYLNVEAAQAAKEEVDKAIPGILQILGMQAQRMVNDSFVAGQWEKQLERSKATFTTGCH